MPYKPILLVAGEPNSVFLEIFFKSLKLKKYESPIILIASKNILIKQMKKLKFNYNINVLDWKKPLNEKLNNEKINLINIDYNSKKTFVKISHKTNQYIKKSFEIALRLIASGISNKLINGPISKEHFLNKKFLGITEYLAHKTNAKNYAMLIYNKKLSVCPITTHLPIKLVSKNININLIVNKIKLIDSFYKKYLKIKPNIAVTGLNPHCESINKINEDTTIIKSSINLLKNKNLRVSGPYPADTIFLKNNRNKFNVIVGMYHDQVLTPIKTLFEYDAINITLGLKFIRISPDHGPNQKMMGKNLSNPLSLIRALEFLDN